MGKSLSILRDKKTILLCILGGFFLVNTIIAEIVGIKIFSLEKCFGFQPMNLSILSSEGLGFNLTAGVLLWPVVFVFTDIINEYFGSKVIRALSLFTVVMVLYAFLMIYGTILLPPNDWWKGESGINPFDASLSITDMNLAYKKVMGQGLKIIVASMIAFILGQMLDVYVFHKIKIVTGESKIWLRATGSTLISQFIDSYVVLIVAFYFLSGWDLTLVLSIGTINYIYKFIIAILMTPVIYLSHDIIERWLGTELAAEMKTDAHSKIQKN